jgi:hypothetical protein
MEWTLDFDVDDDSMQTQQHSLETASAAGYAADGDSCAVCCDKDGFRADAVRC